MDLAPRPSWQSTTILFRTLLIAVAFGWLPTGVDLQAGQQEGTAEPQLAAPRPIRPGQPIPLPTGTSRLRPTIVSAEAFAGKPYGVGKITFRLHPDDAMIDRTEAILVQDPQRRILYPIVTGSNFEMFLQNIRGDRGSSVTGMHTAWFLFDGDQPLQVSLVASDVASREVEVKFVRDRQFDRRVDFEL